MKWTADFSYAVGLITTDGSLSKDGRHLNLTSKDIEQLGTFSKILNLTNKIDTKKSSFNPSGKYFQIQFGNVKLYKFLLSIGLTPNKTKTLGSLLIPDEYFPDFLRGHLDGDGFTYSYWDKRWKKSFMLYTGFISASWLHIEWIQFTIKRLFNLEGKIKYVGRSVYQLLYAKRASVVLLKRLYYKENLPCLSRKRFKINQALGIIMQVSPGAGMADRHA